MFISGEKTVIPGKVTKIAIQKNSTQPGIYALGLKEGGIHGKNIYKLNAITLQWDQLPGQAD